MGHFEYKGQIPKANTIKSGEYFSMIDELGHVYVSIFLGSILEESVFGQQFLDDCKLDMVIVNMLSRTFRHQSAYDGNLLSPLVSLMGLVVFGGSIPINKPPFGGICSHLSLSF